MLQVALLRSVRDADGSNEGFRGIWAPIYGSFRKLGILQGFYRGSFTGLYKGLGSFRKLGIPYFGVLIIMILLFRVLLY